MAVAGAPGAVPVVPVALRGRVRGQTVQSRESKLAGTGALSYSYLRYRSGLNEQRLKFINLSLGMIIIIFLYVII